VVWCAHDCRRWGYVLVLLSGSYSSVDGRCLWSYVTFYIQSRLLDRTGPALVDELPWDALELSSTAQAAIRFFFLSFLSHEHKTGIAYVDYK
jgi:hypothetical protein